MDRAASRGDDDKFVREFGRLKLGELLEEFDGLEPEESLQTLIEMSQDLPELSPERAAEREDTRRLVKECQTPVYLWVDVVDGHAQLEAYVTERSPTVRGYVSMLVEGLSGASATDVATVPEDLLGQLGLAETLGMTRRRGFTGLMRRIKREVAEQVAG